MSPLKALSQLLKSKVAAVAPLVRSMRAAVAASSAQRLVPAPWYASTFLVRFPGLLNTCSALRHRCDKQVSRSYRHGGEQGRTAALAPVVPVKGDIVIP